MRIKYEFAGTEPRKDGLVVYFEVVTGGARRAQKLLVPWTELDDVKVLHEIDVTVRKRLQEVWGKPDVNVAYLPWD